jgi:exo-beta-1,3-glucanase (GH17 family)
MRTVVAVIALVACAHAGFWALTRKQIAATDFEGQLTSVSYSPFANVAHPDKGVLPKPEDIRADLKAIAPYTKGIRLYSSTGGVEMVPGIAADLACASPPARGSTSMRIATSARSSRRSTSPSATAM